MKSLIKLLLPNQQTTKWIYRGVSKITELPLKNNKKVDSSLLKLVVECHLAYNSKRWKRMILFQCSRVTHVQSSCQTPRKTNLLGTTLQGMSKLSETSRTTCCLHWPMGTYMTRSLRKHEWKTKRTDPNASCSRAHQAVAKLHQLRSYLNRSIYHLFICP